MLLIASLLASLVPGVQPRALAQTAIGATLSILAPAVDVALGGAAFAPAQDGQTLHPGDQVRTSPTGVALLTFFDGSETQLTGGAQVLLDSTSHGYFQSIGTTVNRVRVPAGTGFSTDTAPATALVRGTSYVVTTRRLPLPVAPAADNEPQAPALLPLPGDADQTAPSDQISIPNDNDNDTGDQAASAVAVAAQPLVPAVCGPADVSACLTSAILLADPDGHVGRIGIAPHDPRLPAVELATACQVGAVAQQVATAQLAPQTCALLQQSTLDLRDVAAARRTQQQAEQISTNPGNSAAAPGSPPPPPPPPPSPPGPPGPSNPPPDSGSPLSPGSDASSTTWSSTAMTHFGIDEGYRNPALLAETQSTWERLVIPWPAVQPGAPNDFSHLDQILPPAELQAEIARGVHVAGLLQFTPAWAQAHPDQGQRSAPKNLGLPFDDPNNYFGRFVYETVRHYSGRIDEWIIWNEPEFKPGDAAGAGTFTWLGSDEEFAQLLKVGYLAAKKANPNAIVSFPGTSYWVDQNAHRTLFYERLLQILSRDPDAARNNFYHDAVALNLYRAPDDILRVHAIFDAIQHRYGVQKPIWLTEANAMPTDDTQITCRHADDSIPTTMQQQAAYAIQAFALAAAAGYGRAAFYQMVDDNPCQQPAVWGAVRDDGSRRPVADALRTAITSFNGFRRALFTPVSRAEQHWSAWPDDPDSYVPNWQVYVVTFDKPGNSRVTVLWNGDGSPTCVRVRQSGATARAIDKNGAALPLQAVDGHEWQITLAPATAHFSGDPLGYAFIGGDPVLLFEDGVADGAPLGAVSQGCG